MPGRRDEEMIMETFKVGLLTRSSGRWRPSGPEQLPSHMESDTACPTLRMT